MDHENPKFKEWKRNQKPANPVFLKVWEKMRELGELEGLTDDEELEKVVAVTEALIKRSVKK